MLKKHNYTDKFGYNSLQQEIINKFRRIGISEEDTSINSYLKNHNMTFPTFSEFIEYLIDTTKDVESSDDWKEVGSYKLNV